MNISATLTNGSSSLKGDSSGGPDASAVEGHGTGTSTRTVLVDRVLAATGRRPATADLGLEVLGLEPGAALEVDDALEVTAVAGGWLYAVGDVTGRTATTHQGKYDARVVGDVVSARFAPADGAPDDDAAADDASVTPAGR